MTTHHEKGEFDRLKEELRRLKRAGAPWYFESELHRRLHGAHAHRPRLSAFPLNKAYVLTFVALASLAAAGYMMMLHAGFFATHPAAEAGNVAAPPADTLISPVAESSTAHAREPLRGATADETASGSRQGARKGRGESVPALTRAAADSSMVPVAVPDVKGLAQQDSVKGEPQGVRELDRTDTAKSAIVPAKDTSVVRPDSLSTRKDSVKPAELHGPGK